MTSSLNESLSSINFYDVIYVVICVILTAILIAVIRHTVELIVSDSYDGSSDGLQMSPVYGAERVTNLFNKMLRKLAADMFTDGLGSDALQITGESVKVDASTQFKSEMDEIDSIKDHKDDKHASTFQCNGNCMGESTMPVVMETSSSTSRSVELQVLELQRQVNCLEQELETCQTTVTSLRNTEQELRIRLSDQTRKRLDVARDDVRGYRFEDITLDDKTRPTLLIRRFSDLYSEARIELIESFDLQPPDGASNGDEDGTDDDVKNDILLSCIVFSFKHAEHSIQTIRRKIHDVLLRPGDGESSIVRNSPQGGATSSGSSDELPSTVDDAVSSFFVRTAHQRDISRDVQAVLDHVISSTSFPIHFVVRHQLAQFVATCYRLAWTLTVLRPPYCIAYDVASDDRMKLFASDLHTRYHTSDPDSSEVKSVIWPGLNERNTGQCVCKAVVVT